MIGTLDDCWVISMTIDAIYLEIIHGVKFAVPLGTGTVVLSRFFIVWVLFIPCGLLIVRGLFIVWCGVGGGLSTAFTSSFVSFVRPCVLLVLVLAATRPRYRSSSLVLDTWSDSKIVTLLGARVFCLANSIFEGLMNCQC